MSDGLEKPKPHPRSSRQRHREFIKDYHARRLDDACDKAGQSESDADTGARIGARMFQGKRREYVREYHKMVLRQMESAATGAEEVWQ